MADLDRLKNLGAIGDVVTDAIVNVEFTLLLQQQDGHSRELFGDAGDPEFGLWRIWDFLLTGGEAIALAQNHLTIACHQNRTIVNAFLVIFLHQSIDFFPTFVDMLGWEMPADLSFDGVSMKPTLEKNQEVRDEIFCHFPHNKPCTSLRKGDWKLIRWYFDQPDGNHRYELYNLAEDEGESHNLALQESKRVMELSERMDEILLETEALIPLPNPDYVADRH